MAMKCDCPADGNYAYAHDCPVHGHARVRTHHDSQRFSEVAVANRPLQDSSCHGAGHLSAGLQNVQVGVGRVKGTALDIKTPDMVEIGTAARSARNGMAKAHFVIPESGGNGTDHATTWCGGGYAYIETPHPRAKFCSKCRALAEEYWEEYGDE